MAALQDREKHPGQDVLGNQQDRWPAALMKQPGGIVAAAHRPR